MSRGRGATCQRAAAATARPRGRRATAPPPSATASRKEPWFAVECGGTTPLWMVRVVQQPKRCRATALHSAPLPARVTQDDFTGARPADFFLLLLLLFLLVVLLLFVLLLFLFLDFFLFLLLDLLLLFLLVLLFLLLFVLLLLFLFLLLLFHLFRLGLRLLHVFPAEHEKRPAPVRRELVAMAHAHDLPVLRGEVGPVRPLVAAADAPIAPVPDRHGRAAQPVEDQK